MGPQELPKRFYVKPKDSYSNKIILLNQEDGVLGETRIIFKKKPLRVLEVTVDFLKVLRRNKPSFEGFNYTTYAEINDRIQRWQLLEFRKEARVAKARKDLRKIGQRKIEQKRQAPLA